MIHCYNDTLILTVTGLAVVLSLIIVGVIVAVLVAVILMFNKDSSVPEQTNGTLYTCNTLCICAPFHPSKHIYTHSIASSPPHVPRLYKW